MRDRPTGAGPVGGGGATAALAVAGATSARARRAMGRRMGPPSLREAERRRQRAHPRPGVPIREPRLPSPTMAPPPAASPLEAYDAAGERVIQGPLKNSGTPTILQRTLGLQDRDRVGPEEDGEQDRPAVQVALHQGAAAGAAGGA